MAWWWRSKRAERRDPASKPTAPARRSTDRAILQVSVTSDEISVGLADGIDPVAHDPATIAWSLEHYRLSVTNAGMRDVSAVESAVLVGDNPDLAAGLTEVRVFAYPLVLARALQAYPDLFDTVRTALADTPQPMQVSRFQQVQKAAVEQLAAALKDSGDDPATLHALKEMLHWSY